MSPYHKTLFIQNSSGNFTWNQYEIEGLNTGGGVPVPALSNYLFQRDNLSNGNWVTIQTLSASSLAYTDAAYATYQNTATWRVKTLWSISCTPTMINPKNPESMAVTVNNTRSNTYRVSGAGINEINNAINISISPNPSDGQFRVTSTVRIQSVEIYNVLGEKVHSEIVNDTSFIVHCTLPNGIYVAHIKTEKGIVLKKIIVAN